MFAVLILQLCPPIEYCNLIHQQKGRKAQQNRSYQASRNLRGRGKKRGRERGRLPWGNPPRHAVLRRRACRCGKGFREPFTPRKLRVPRAWDRDTGQEEEETPKVRDAPARRRPAEEGTRSLSEFGRKKPLHWIAVADPVICKRQNSRSRPQLNFDFRVS